MAGKFEAPRDPNRRRKPIENQDSPRTPDSQDTPRRKPSDNQDTPRRRPPENTKSAPQRRRKKRRKRPLVPVLILLIVLLIAAVLFLIHLATQPDDESSSTDTTKGNSFLENLLPDAETTTAPTETTPEPVHVVSTATVSSTGDILMHMPVVNAGLLSDGTYNFDFIFQYLSDYVSATDFAVANLETTLSGTDNGYSYSGYPCFNCPDEIVDAVVNAGFNMLLTANNHTYDTRSVGMYRTLSVIEEAGILSLGTTATAETPKYVVEEINGISIGMVCYTYETTDNSLEQPSLNGIYVSMDDADCLNSFDYNQLDKFYAEMEEQIADMRSDGAEAIILFIHWGDEYSLTPNSYQTAIAQEMCDLGVDVIIGGHPHVVQPMDLLTSTVDSDHKTVCLYSMGNAVSNQNRTNISSCPSGHCEDGTWFSVTFAKYSDGTVVLESADLVPTWVNWQGGSGEKYSILPLDADTMDDWQVLYNLSDTAYSYATGSYDRTMALVGEGLEECQTYLADAQALREWEYLAEVDPEAAGEKPTTSLSTEAAE